MKTSAHMMVIHETTVDDCSGLRVAVGTTGECGGDSGHGCKTIIEIQDCYGSDIECFLLDTRDDGEHRVGVRIELGGDSELRTISNAVHYISKILKQQIAETRSRPNQGTENDVRE